MTALSEAPDLYELPTDPEARKAWRIEHDGQAAWAMRKCRDAAARRRQVEKTATEEIERIEQWVIEQCAETDREAEQFEQYLADYALRQREASGGEVKRVSTPYGVVQSRVTPARWEQDEAQLIAWAKERHPELVLTSERFDLAAAKRVFGTVGDAAVDPETQELVPGLTVIPGRLAASVLLASGGGL